MNLHYCKPKTYDDAISELLLNASGSKDTCHATDWIGELDIWRAAMESAIGVVNEVISSEGERSTFLRQSIIDRLADLRDAGRP